MTNYAPKQRLLTPERAAKLAAARARRRERLKKKQNEKQILKQQRKQLVRGLIDLRGPPERQRHARRQLGSC